MKNLIIDKRMRNIEKEYLKSLGYSLIEISKSSKTYEEISSHVDIFTCKIGNKLIIEPSKYNEIAGFVSNYNDIEKGKELIGLKYPNDVKYNVCIIGKKALHKFDCTDFAIKEELIKGNYEMINTTQGYTNCSIAVIDDNSAIVTDKGVYKILKKHNIDVLYLDCELDIKLLKSNEYSKRKGFIGGTISRVGNNIVIFGDLNKIDNENVIRNFIISKNLNIVEFENLDVIDYGGVVEI